jgi:hypothetical protein
VVNATCSLSVDGFPVADAALAEKLPGLTTVRARHAAARIVIGIDAEAARVRAEKNRADARVSLHPDVDGVAILHVRGPAEQIVAAHHALDAWARGLRATGDPRSRGQIMVQTLVERVTGWSHADSADVEVQVVMDAETTSAHGQPCPHVLAVSWRRIKGADRSLTHRPPGGACGLGDDAARSRRRPRPDRPRGGCR